MTQELSQLYAMENNTTYQMQDAVNKQCKFRSLSRFAVRITFFSHLKVLACGECAYAFQIQHSLSSSMYFLSTQAKIFQWCRRRNRAGDTRCLISRILRATDSLNTLNIACGRENAAAMKQQLCEWLANQYLQNSVSSVNDQLLLDHISYLHLDLYFLSLTLVLSHFQSGAVVLFLQYTVIYRAYSSVYLQSLTKVRLTI